MYSCLKQPSFILTSFCIRRDNNAPIHIAKQTSKYFKEAQITVMEWPPQSPDLNPIEHLSDAINCMASNSDTHLESLYCCLEELMVKCFLDMLFKVLYIQVQVHVWVHSMWEDCG